MPEADKIKYKEEGQRRMRLRKEKRNAKYRGLARICDEHNCPISGAKGGSWYDSSSPTGYMQICDYQGTCESPCNGDC